ncbi:MAG: hypothetical protein KJ956_14670, partial [Actinobacteria bacterium]|nr:hypothetical protein [Actinomycetota bacterium]
IAWRGSSSQIEVGSHYVGVELHKSSIRPNRISFYFPVGNSIDISRDYWKRGEYPILQVGLRVGEGSKKVLGTTPFAYELTPYSVHFSRSDNEKTMKVSYEFCKTKAAMVLKFDITNNCHEKKTFELYTQLETSVKTSYTYALKNIAWTSYDHSTIYTYHLGKDTANTVLYVSNAGTLPQSFTSKASTLKNWWKEKNYDLPGEVIDNKEKKQPLAAFIYRKLLMPGETLAVVQIIGAERQGEEKTAVRYLQKNFQKEIKLYETSLIKKVNKQGFIISGNQKLDYTAKWAQLMITSLDHNLDNSFVPMPCPAQYNFFFTHDVLVTNLAMVNLDLARVKRDLKFVAEHANAQGIIPHAYYWKDDKYVTEFTGDDGWNHFWFVLVAARYLRHSGDIDMLKKLYPMLEKSTERFLVNKKNGLIYAYRPDWWDIGKSFGPRSYMTILAIRALREFIYISTILDKCEKNVKYEEIAEEMKCQLTKKLWDNKLQYLINYNNNGEDKDTHYYTGSLLAAHFSLLSDKKQKSLLNTAKSKLVDEQVGVYNAYPMDFHKLNAYFKFHEGEQGAPFYYMNGGVWYQGNAWYALGLISDNRQKEALSFMNKIMTLTGIMNGPNGQPAMYECRNANKNNISSYGKIDKPMFLWAGGWYLYTLQNLLGLRENVWNISIEPFLIANRAKYTVFVNARPITILVHGNGRHIKNIKYDGIKSYSAVVSGHNFPTKTIEIEMGKAKLPYLANTQAILLSVIYKVTKKNLILHLRAFPGHKNTTKIMTLRKPQLVKLNETALKESNWRLIPKDGIYELEITFCHQSQDDIVSVIFSDQ